MKVATEATMSTLTRSSFIEENRNKQIKLNDVKGLTANQKAAIAGANGNGDGKIAGRQEMSRLFTAIDGFDKNGSANSVNTQARGVSSMLASVRAAAKPATGAPAADSAQGSGGVQPSGSRSQKLSQATQRARELGLRITSTTGGKHAPNSYHYKARAVDVAGPPRAMAQFYREMSRTNPTELFYDPIGGMKNGRNIGPIGGHGNHVHVAY
jgi:hypothetical protein